MGRAMAALLLILLSVFVHSNAGEEGFDVRQHLSTASRYGVVKDIADKSFVPSKIPDGCTPIHLNLVARHGTRAPTKKRIKDMDILASRLEVLLKEAEEQNLSLEKLPGWLKGWKSPWKGKLTGGELIVQGEDELYDFGIRTRERFPNLFDQDYHPDVYTIKATQVPRASASAVAFGMGMFSGKGNLGPGRHRAFAVSSESRASDVMLRFHDCCQNYKAYKKSQEPAVDKLKEPVYDEITSSLRRRYKLNFTKKDATSLWFLCKQEASLFNITDQACALFTPSEVSLLEWADDLEAFILKGYGKSLNYRMGVPLLEDVLQSMEQAITAEEEKHAPGNYEQARLRFAHAETVVPFSCLLGLFLDGSEFQRIQKEQPLQLPPKPPQKRKWRGNTVAPFGGNNMLVLYSCPANTSSKYFVQVLHNEHPIPMPGCDGSDFCPLDVFKERIVAPHLKHDYNSVCNAKLAEKEEKPSKTLEAEKPRGGQGDRRGGQSLPGLAGTDTLHSTLRQSRRDSSSLQPPPVEALLQEPFQDHPCRLYKYFLCHEERTVDMSEWLRRQTRNLLGFACAGESIYRPAVTMASHAPNLECRMYEARYPEVDMAVMIQVKNIADMGAYVSLLEYNNIEGMILFSELSRRRIRSVSSLIKVGRIEPVMVLRVDKEKGYIDLSKRRVSEEDIQACEERYNKSKLVHSIMRHVGETLGIDLEDLYVNIGWPLYRKYGHAFEAFKIVVTDPDSVLSTLTREVKEVGPDGQEVTKVVPAVSEEIKESLVKNIRRRMTPQPLKIRADIEMKCFQFDGVLHIKDAMRKAEAVGNSDCPVKIKLVAPPLYVLTTQTLDKEQGISVLSNAIVACTQEIEHHKGKLTVKEAPRVVSERDDKLLAEHMSKLRQENEEVSGDEGSEEEEDTGMGEVNIDGGPAILD